MGLSSIGLLEALPLIIPSIQLQLSIRTFLDKHSPDIVVHIFSLSLSLSPGHHLHRSIASKVCSCTEA